MWIVALALRRPYTFVVMALLILILTPVTVLRMPTDIFPEIDIPVVSVIWFYTGMAPQDMADRIVANSERGINVAVTNIEHTESQSVYGLGVIKIFFRPGTDIQGAIAQITAITQVTVRGLPPGTTPPLVISYNASTTPIIQLGLSSKILPEQQIFDLGNSFLRNFLATVPGSATPYPYGGKVRQVQVDLDLPKLQAYNLSPVDIVNAVNAQNLILPTGTVKLGPLENNVEMNGSPATIAELNDMPVKTVNGATLYMRDVAHIRDGFAPQTNIVRQDGNRGGLMSIYKNGKASTLEIVAALKKIVPVAAESLPPELKISLLFDQSLFVRASIQGVIREALLAALLTAVMILLFLGDWRPTIVIAISIPLSIFCSILLLAAIGETLNIMTLGGLALAVGILVDDATVEIENIERNLAMGKEMRKAILDGAQQIAVPAFVSTLCICIVFVPMFFLSGVARFLFVPLAEAVSFAMLASYLLSRTLIPTLVMYIMRGHEHRAAGPKTFLGRFQRGFERGFERFRCNYQSLLETVLEHRGIFVSCFLLFCLLSLGLLAVLGQDFFPQVDAGLLRLHVRARPGLRVEETARLCDEVEAELHRQIPGNEIQTILDNIGLPNSGINQSYSSSGTVGSSDAEILISLDPEHHHPTADHIRNLRKLLPQRFPGVEFFFQPADIVTQILNFGLPAPIDVQVIGTDQQSNYDIAQQIANQMRHVPGAADVHVQQLLSLPTLHMDLDRTRITQVGLNAQQVAQSVLVYAQRQLPDGAQLLAESEERRYLPDGGAGAAIPHHQPRRPDGGSGEFAARLAVARQPGADQSRGAPGGGQPLQRAAGHRRLCQHTGPRSGRGGSGHRKDHPRLRRPSAARHAHHSARPGHHHALLVRGTGRRTAGRDRARLSADRGQLPVVARPVHHHLRPARRAGGHLLVPAAHPHHAERAVADRRGDVHGRGHRQLHSDGQLCARADG